MKIALIAGWGMAASVWPVQQLQAQGHDVHVFDLITAQHAAADFDYLIGWSLGGVIALQRAQQCQAKVLLLASLPIMVQREDFPGGIDAIAFKNFAEFFQQDQTAALQHFLKLQTLGCAQPRALQKKLSEHLLAQPSDLNQLSNADARDAWKILQQQQRLQVVFAQQDALMPADRVQQALKDLPAVPVQWIDGGHAQCVQSPEQWMQWL